MNEFGAVLGAILSAFGPLAVELAQAAMARTPLEDVLTHERVAKIIPQLELDVAQAQEKARRAGAGTPR